MTTIKHRFSGSTLCEFDVATIRECAEKGRANLGGADLGEADLGGADLYGANLRGANLGGANLGEKIGKVKAEGYFTVGPLGSRKDMLIAWRTDKGIFIKAGCFFDSMELFRAAVIKTHGENSKHGKLYLRMCNVIEFKFSEELK